MQTAEEGGCGPPVWALGNSPVWCFAPGAGSHCAWLAGSGARSTAAREETRGMHNVCVRAGPLDVAAADSTESKRPTPAGLGESITRRVEASLLFLP